MFNYSTNSFYKQFILLIAFLCIGFTAKAEVVANLSFNYTQVGHPDGATGYTACGYDDKDKIIMDGDFCYNRGKDDICNRSNGGQIDGYLMVKNDATGYSRSKFYFANGNYTITLYTCGQYAGDYYAPTFTIGSSERAAETSLGQQHYNNNEERILTYNFTITTAGTYDIAAQFKGSDKLYFKNVVIESESPAVTHILTLSDDSHGTAVSDQPDDTAIAEGTSVTVTATPATGYKFAAWKEGTTTVSTDAEYTFTMGADKNLQATFVAVQQYTLTVAVDDAAHGTVTGAGTFYEGASVTVVATQASGWRISKWIDSEDHTLSTKASYTFTMPGHDIALTAVFISEDACISTLKLECEDFVEDVTIVNSSAATALTPYIERNSNYAAYGAISGSFVDMKDAASEIFIPFSVFAPSASYAATCHFEVSYANTDNAWVNVWRETTSSTYDIEYDGKHFYKYGYARIDNGKTSTWTTNNTPNWSIMPDISGSWLVSIYGPAYSGFDYIIVTSSDPQVTFCDYQPAPLATHELSINTTPADGSWGTAASNQPDESAIEEGASVTVTATPAAGYYFSAWMNGTTKVSGSAVYTFVMPNEDYTLTAVFTDVEPTENCDATLHIEAEDFVNVTVKSSGTATSAQTVAEQGTPKYGTARNDAIAWFKGSNSEVYYPFSVSDAVGNITFTVKLADAKNTWLNLWELSTIADYDIEYNGQYYKKYHDGKSLSATEYGQTWEKPTVSYSNLPLGQYLVSIYGENWTAIDYIEAVSSNPSTNYCVAVLPKHTVTATANDAAYGSVSPAVSSVEEGKNITVRATPEDGYSFVCWESDDITLTEEQKHRVLLSVPMGTSDITLTANFAPVYTAWPWHDGISEWAVSNATSDKGFWDNQVTLGPEHFTTAVVGGKILVKVKNKASNAQGAFQNTTEYNTIDKHGKAYDEASGQELYSGWEAMRDSLGSAWDFDLKNGNFYHTITATSLAELKQNGVIVKGQHYTISEIQIIGNCENPIMRDAPDVTIANIVYDYTATTSTNNYVWWPGFPEESKKGTEEFCFGEWEHKLKFPKTAFINVNVGDIIRIRVRQADLGKDCRISYRCDTTWIDAGANPVTHPGKTVKTTGDITFDRTITNLGGDAPDPEGYVDMRVDDDMLARLKETGLIIFGENACLTMVEICHGPYIIREDETRYVPKCGVDSLIIYQGGQALNTDSVKVYEGVEYIRPAVGGKHGNLLSHWYTFTVPYQVTSTKVLDESDHNYYDINCVFHKGGDDPDNPTGVGYFYLQSLTSDGKNDGIEEIFRARWDYIYETQPQALEPYIIMFTNYGDGYFATNPTIKFCGGRNSIAGINQIKTVPASGVEYWMYPNNTMHDITIPGSAYVLNEGTNLFELEDNPTIAPFECYVQATAGFKALHPVIAHPGYSRTNNNSATSVGDTQGWSLSIINDGQSKVLLSAVDQTVCIFSAVGQMVASVRLQSGEAQTLSLPRGTYIINTVDGPRKVMF